MNWLLKTPIAHRGLHNINDSIPENSLIAFEKAVQKSLPIELDVRILNDDKVIVIHDLSLERLTGIKKLVSEASFSELKHLSLYGTDQKIPELSEVLSLVNGRVPVLIEIKNEGRVERLEEEVFKIIKNYKGELAVQSFNPFSLIWFKTNAPWILRGQLSSSFGFLNAEVYKKIMLRYMFLNWKSKPDFISYDISALPNWRVSGIRKNGIPVLSWTIKKIEDVQKAKKFSDNFIFENIHTEEFAEV